MKLCIFTRASFKHLASRFSLSKSEEGSFLIEALIAAVILLIIASTAVTQLTTLTKIKVETETRDRALILANGLHENMQAAGCGFDVSNVKDSVNVSGDPNEIAQQPWARISTCAFKAIKSSGAADEDGNVEIGNDISDAVNFCSSQPLGRCEMGDQEFDREVNLNLDNRKVKFHVTVNYWFEKTGQTNSAIDCSTGVGGTVKQPDVIVRKVNIQWPNLSMAGGIEDITVVKRQNIPVDTIAFSSAARVGVFSNNNVTMYSSISGKDILQVTRLKKTKILLGKTSVKGGANCVWFPYVDKDAIPQFSVNNASPATPILASVNALENKEL